MEKSKLILKVDDTLWEEFKATVPRNLKLNDAVVNLIKEAVKNAKG